MNTTSLFKYGSLEFRALRTPTDLNVVVMWAEILHRMKEFSLTFTDPADVVGSMSAQGAGFARHVLGDHFENFNDLNVDYLLTRGVRRAQDLAFCVAWEGFEIPKR